MNFETIEQTTVLEASPVEVYEAYTDPKKHSEFTGSPATGRPRVGATFTAWDGYITGRFVELDRGKKVVQEWKTTEWPPEYPPSVLELTFKARGKKTVLTMVHSKVPAEQAPDYAQGWKDHYWKPLKAYLERSR